MCRANKDWHLVVKFWRTDLSYITTLLKDDYSAKGPEPRDSASMLRSYLLFLMTKPEMGITEWMIRHDDKKSDLPSDRLFQFFQTQILAISANLGLLGDMNALTVAGDGTPIVTSVYTRNKPTCNCRAQGLANCNHPRIYSQPDCNAG